MPLPKPGEGEPQGKFASRCMGDAVMVKEFPDTERRLAVCYSLWKRAKGKELEYQSRTPEADQRLKAKPFDDDAFEETDTGIVYGKADEDPGWIEGYLAVFNNIDAQREVVRPGCFAKSARERIPAGKVPLMTRHFAHGGDSVDVIGTITQGKEDDFGLWIHADLSPDPHAQMVRGKVAGRHVKKLSVGYSTLKWNHIPWEDGKTATELLEARLLDGIVTVRPANEQAVILAAKALESAIQDADPTSAGQAERPQVNWHDVAEALNTLGKKVDELVASSAEAEPDVAQAVVHSLKAQVLKRRLALTLVR